MHSRRRCLEVPLKIRLRWRCPMDLRVVVNERQILTLLRRELRRGPPRCDLASRRLVGVLLEKMAEPIAESVEYPLDLAIAMIKPIILFADPSSRSNATAASVIRLAVELNSEDGRYASRLEFSDTRGSPSPWM